jgi:uncharacterized protein
MKKIGALLLACFSIGIVKAQNASPFPKTIQVNGSAEMEIVPDEIYVEVTLKEYDKKGSGKVDIDKIKSGFLSAYKSLGMPDSLISVLSYDGDNGDIWYRKKKKKEELYNLISYQIKFANTTKMDELVDKLDDQATQSFRIIKTSHSKLEELRKQLKIQAVKAAKEKADYLAASIDEKIGQAITIEEPNEYYYPFQNNFASNKAIEMAVRESASDEPAVDFKKIKLRYEVKVVFALK